MLRPKRAILRSMLRGHVRLKAPLIVHIVTNLFNLVLKRIKCRLQLGHISKIPIECDNFFLNFTLVLSLPSTPEPLKMKYKMHFDVSIHVNQNYNFKLRLMC